jgi:hypothetical protein
MLDTPGISIKLPPGFGQRRQAPAFGSRFFSIFSSLLAGEFMSALPRKLRFSVPQPLDEVRALFLRHPPDVPVDRHLDNLTGRGRIDLPFDASDSVFQVAHVRTSFAATGSS